MRGILTGVGPIRVVVIRRGGDSTRSRDRDRGWRREGIHLAPGFPRLRASGWLAGSAATHTGGWRFASRVGTAFLHGRGEGYSIVFYCSCFLCAHLFWLPSHLLGYYFVKCQLGV